MVPSASNSSLPAPLSLSQTSFSSASRLPSSPLAQNVSRPQKKIPPMLSRAKAANLVSQSQIFKDSFVSIGRLKYPLFC